MCGCVFIGDVCTNCPCVSVCLSLRVQCAWKSTASINSFFFFFLFRTRARASFLNRRSRSELPFGPSQRRNSEKVCQGPSRANFFFSHSLPLGMESCLVWRRRLCEIATLTPRTTTTTQRVPASSGAWSSGLVGTLAISWLFQSERVSE